MKTEGMKEQERLLGVRMPDEIDYLSLPRTLIGSAVTPKRSWLARLWAWIRAKLGR
jgi:hypothetical protein